MPDYQEQAEALLRAAESSSASHESYVADLITALVGVGYATLAKSDGKALDNAPAAELGSVVARGNREGYINEMTAIFADTIRDHVTPGVRTELAIRFERNIREKLAW